MIEKDKQLCSDDKQLRDVELNNDEHNNSDEFGDFVDSEGILNEDDWPADSLTDEERKQIAEDFKKDDLHLIIGNHINGDEEYKRCIDWPKASKEDMLRMEHEVSQRLLSDLTDDEIQESLKSPWNT